MIDHKRAINLTLSPWVIEKLDGMSKNAGKLYGHDYSRSAIVQHMIIKAGDRKSQIQSRLKSLQKEICDLGDELAAIVKKEEEEAKQ